MPYCTVQDLRNVLPAKVTIGDTNIGTPQPGRTSTTRSNLSPNESLKYINYAQQYIDSKLRPFYSCPLRRTKSFETETLSNISPGTSVSVTVNDSGPFIRGDIVRLQNKSSMETATVASTPDITTVNLESVTGSYTVADASKISIVEFPDPIPVVAARLACSFILDRLFVAEQSPDVSNYGENQRNLARNDMDDILTGETLLFGQEHTGRRFIRGSLFDAYKSPSEVEKGQENV